MPSHKLQQGIAPQAWQFDPSPAARSKEHLQLLQSMVLLTGSSVQIELELGCLSIAYMEPEDIKAASLMMGRSFCDVGALSITEIRWGAWWPDGAPRMPPCARPLHSALQLGGMLIGTLRWRDPLRLRCARPLVCIHRQRQSSIARLPASLRPGHDSEGGAHTRRV